MSDKLDKKIEAAYDNLVLAADKLDAQFYEGFTPTTKSARQLLTLAVRVNKQATTLLAAVEAKAAKEATAKAKAKAAKQATANA